MLHHFEFFENFEKFFEKSPLSPKLGVVWGFLFIYKFLIEISTNPYILGPNKTNPQQLGIFKRFVFQQIQSFAWLHEKSHLPWNPIYWTNHNFAWSSRQTDTMDDGDRRDPFMLKNKIFYCFKLRPESRNYD